MASFSKPKSGAPQERADGKGLKEFRGELVLITPKELRTDIPRGKYATEEKPTMDGIVVDYVVLTGPDAGDQDTSINFQARFVRQLRNEIGSPVLARIGRDLDAEGAPWQLEDYSDEDAELASKFLDTGEL